MPPGRYTVPFEGADPSPVSAEIDILDGFTVYNESVLWSDDDPPRGLLLWTVSGVNPDPCTGLPPEYDDPGPTVQNLATALGQQPHRRGAAPRPVRLAGYDGLYLELTFPRGFIPGSCATGSYEAWNAVDPVTHQREERYQYGPGFVDRIWILDADGQRVVVNATYDRRLPERQLAALEEMVDSIAIGRTIGGDIGGTIGGEGSA